MFSESNAENEQTTSRRLTREEDELEDSDDDGIIVMSGIVSQAEDRKKSLHSTMSGKRKCVSPTIYNNLFKLNNWF